MNVPASCWVISPQVEFLRHTHIVFWEMLRPTGLTDQGNRGRLREREQSSVTGHILSTKQYKTEQMLEHKDTMDRWTTWHWATVLSNVHFFSTQVLVASFLLTVVLVMEFSNPQPQCLTTKFLVADKWYSSTDVIVMAMSQLMQCSGNSTLVPSLITLNL